MATMFNLIADESEASAIGQSASVANLRTGYPPPQPVIFP